jgi:hypothetical protein
MKNFVRSIEKISRLKLMKINLDRNELNIRIGNLPTFKLFKRNTKHDEHIDFGYDYGKPEWKNVRRFLKENSDVYKEFLK